MHSEIMRYQKTTLASLLTVHTEFVSVQDKSSPSSIKHYDNEPFFQSI